MSIDAITTSTGTTVTLVDWHGDVCVVVDNPAAPTDMRNMEIGRVLDGAYQPAPFCAFGLRPELLRAIATLTEQTTETEADR